MCHSAANLPEVGFPPWEPREAAVVRVLLESGANSKAGSGPGGCDIRGWRSYISGYTYLERKLSREKNTWIKKEKRT